MEPAEIMTILGASTSTYPREAVQAAMDQNDKMVPLLLAELERVHKDPERYLDATSDSFLPIHVLALLGYHQVSEAHALVVALASLPGEMPFRLFGDAIHEVLPKVLWQTSRGDTTDIIRLVRHKEVNEYCRSSAISALLFGVAEQRLSREEVVELLQGLFTGDEANREEPMVWNAAASALADLWPGESMDVLRQGYEDGLIDPGFINLDDITGLLEQGKEARLAHLSQSRRAGLERTPHEDLSRWACFERTSRLNIPLVIEANKHQKDRKKAKNKRKQARSARKKSRGGKKRKK